MFLLLPLLGAILPARAAESPRRVLILFSDGKQTPDPSRANALALKQMILHFALPTDIQPMSGYRPGMLRRYRFAFVAEDHPGAALPPALLADARRYRGSLWWMDFGLEQLGPAFLKEHGLQYQGVDRKTAFGSLRYHQATLLTGDDPGTPMHLVRVTEPRRCRVVAEAFAGKTTVPYVVCARRFWYVADWPLVYFSSRQRYFAFGDMLHTFFGISHRAQRRALLRIEDVNPSEDAASLRTIADLLSREKVPYLIALIPRYIDGPQERYDMTRKPEFIGALRYMLAHGATPVLHGYTHQYRQGKTGVDFEFWNQGTDRPVKEDSPAWVTDRLDKALRLCFTAGVYPLAWETPHYTASSLDYTTIGRYFSTTVEQRIFLDKRDFGIYVPYAIKKDLYGQQVFPESLGYVPIVQKKGTEEEDVAAEEREVDAILADAKAARVCRDVSLGAFFHPYLDSERLLPRLVQGFKRLGYRFINLRAETNRVQLGDRLILSGTTAGQVRLRKQYLHEFYLSPTGAVQHERYSRRPITGIVRRRVACTPGWIYVCEGLAHPRPTQSASKRRPIRRGSAPPAPSEG